ncbi:MAG: hypothetical protein CMJ78_16555, partial [Planctomycetaceae bacterium]|nr:hypothetical protein [Planctomycetaceae bacterium]
MLRLFLPLIIVSTTSVAIKAEDADVNKFSNDVQSLLKKYCHECHSGDLTEAEIDLGAFKNIGDVRKQTKVWIKVRGILESGQMPPKDSPQMLDVERALLTKWVRGFLLNEAKKHAGDPGRVVLRRLNNDEYNYTLQDLTGVTALNPTREFPVDGAAGEGFTNSGSAQGMSPSLVRKYLDAAKEVSEHVVFLPDGIDFSQFTTQRDQTDERVARIQAFYRRFTSEGGGQPVNLQGIQFDTNQGGVLPLKSYLLAIIENRDAVANGEKSIAQVASERGLNGKYLGKIWPALIEPRKQRSLFFDIFGARVRNAKPSDVDLIIKDIKGVQATMFRFNSIGHIGKQGKPKVWMEQTNPVVSNRVFSIKIPETTTSDVTICLIANDAGDGDDGDFVAWKNPRLTRTNDPDIPLRDVAGLLAKMTKLQQEALQKTTQYLAAATAVEKLGPDVTKEQIAKVAEDSGLDLDALNAWLSYLVIGETKPVIVSGMIREKHSNPNYNFVKGWGSSQTPIILANSSDQQVRIPGISRPHGVTAHPSPTLFIALGWKSPIDGLIQVDAQLSDAHPECGNGQSWFLQHRNSRKVGNLWKGDFTIGGKATMPTQKISIRKGELISFIIGPRQG